VPGRLKSSLVLLNFFHCVGQRRLKSRGSHNTAVAGCTLAGCTLIDLNDQIGDMNYSNYIEIVPEKKFGRPCIKGTRISVYDVLNWLANGMTKDEIIEDFPELGMEQINACLSFAADKEHKLRIAS
jgi:uncharacterized protein (DUF433 family)